jgi:hypothetical protein
MQFEPKPYIKFVEESLNVPVETVIKKSVRLVQNDMSHTTHVQQLERGQFADSGWSPNQDIHLIK